MEQLPDSENHTCPVESCLPCGYVCMRELNTLKGLEFNQRIINGFRGEGTIGGLVVQAPT